MNVTLGRIVHYKLNDSDAQAINGRRVGTAGHSKDWSEGAQAHTGNRAVAGQLVPAIVVSKFGEGDSDLVNLQCLLDGNDSFWATSRHQGNEDGQWQWPERV